MRRLTARIGLLVALGTVGIASGIGPAQDSRSSSLPIQGSGVLRDEVRPVGPFTAVQVENVLTATVSPGAPGVRLSGDVNILPLIVTEVRSGWLVVRVRRDVSFSTSRPVRATITTPRLAAVSARGASRIEVTGTGSGAFRAWAGGVSRITVEDLAAAETDLVGQDNSQMTITGAPRALKLNLSDLSRVQAGDLAADEVEARLSDLASGTIRAARTLRGDLSGMAKLTVLGSADPAGLKVSGSAQVLYPERSPDRSTSGPGRLPFPLPARPRIPERPRPRP